MTLDNDEADLRDTRALTQKLWSQCRDSNNRFQSLAGDLRKLRNLLEDIEKYLSSGSSAGHTFTQVAQCKAILYGLDLTLQSFRCVRKEQQNVQPEAVLTGKASIQVATSSLLTASDGLRYSREHAVRSDTHELPVSVNDRSPTSGGTSHNAVATATNVKLSVQSSARIISLGNHAPINSHALSLKSIQEGKRALGSSSLGTNSSSAIAFPHSNWRSPFALPNPLSFDDSRACTLLTSRPVRFTPRITIEEYKDSTHATVATMGQEPNGTSDGQPAEHFIPQRMSDEYDSIIPRTLSHIERHQSLPAAPMYVPYRPWYSPSQSPVQELKSPTRVDSHADMSGMQELHEEKSNTDVSGTELADPSSLTTDAGTSSLMRTRKLGHSAERERHAEQPEEMSIEQSVPPMPTRTPPPPPIHRSKFKPQQKPVANATGPDVQHDERSTRPLMHARAQLP